MALNIPVDDVIVFNDDLDRELVQILLRDGLAMARIIAPCIDEPDFLYADAAAAIIRGAVLRWAESGSGAVQTQSQAAGPFSESTTFDTRQTRRSLFYPSERTELEKLCRSNAKGAYAVDMIPGTGGVCPRNGNQAFCPYMLGSTSSPCEVCGVTLNPTYWGGSLA